MFSATSLLTHKADTQARTELSRHSTDAVRLFNQWDAEKRERLIVACMSQLWTPDDSKEFYYPDSSPEVSKLVARYGPDEEDKRALWSGVAVDLRDLSSRPIWINADGQEVVHSSAPTLCEVPARSRTPSLRASSSDTASPTSCSPRSAKSAKSRDDPGSAAVVTALQTCAPDARDIHDAHDAHDAKIEEGPFAPRLKTTPLSSAKASMRRL